MKGRTVLLVAFGTLGVCGIRAAADRVEPTMVVNRCQAMDDKGRQCKNEAESGKKYCWRHNKAMRSLQNTSDEVGKSADAAWKSTKQWSTNAWEQTKSGFRSAWEGTKEAAEEARVGIVEMFGGEGDASK